MPRSILARLLKSRASEHNGIAGWRWPAILIALLGVLAVVLLYHRWRETGFRWDAFAASFLDLKWSWLAAAALIAIATYFGRALRWAVMLRPIKAHPSLRGLFTATAIGFTALVLLGRPGEFVRPYLIAVKERVPLSSQLAAWLLERIYDLLAVLLVFGFALSQVRDSRGSLGPALEWVLQTGGYIAAGISTACLIVLLAVRWLAEPIRDRLIRALGFLRAHHLEKAERILNAFVEGLASTRQAGSVAQILFYTVLEWVLITACYVCLFRAYPATEDFTVREILIFMGFVALGSVVQIPGVGGGMQIVAVLVLTELFQLRLEPATSLAILIWIITFVVIVPFGLILAAREGLKWTKLRELKQQASL